MHCKAIWAALSGAHLARRKASQGEAPATKRAATAYQIFTKERRHQGTAATRGVKQGGFVRSNGSIVVIVTVKDRMVTN